MEWFLSIEYKMLVKLNYLSIGWNGSCQLSYKMLVKLRYKMLVNLNYKNQTANLGLIESLFLVSSVLVNVSIWIMPPWRITVVALSENNQNTFVQAIKAKI